MKDFDAVAMKGEVLNSLTQATDEVDEDAQVKKLTSLSSFLRWKGKLYARGHALPQNNKSLRS